MTYQSLLGKILERLGRADPMLVVFGADEIADWPEGALEALTNAGLLKPAQPAQALVCDGCEQSCFMQVNVLPTAASVPARAFIQCDKREDISRVEVDLNRLRQWKVTGGALAKVLAKLLGYAQPMLVDRDSRCWALGMLKGAKHKGQITLAVEDGVRLTIAGHRISLVDVLAFDGQTLAIDRGELLRLVDHPVGQPGAHRYSPSVARRESHKLDTQQRYAAWRKVAKELRRKPQGHSERWVSQQIEKMPIARGSRAETIRKHIRR